MPSCMWYVNGCFCRLGIAGQLFSGDSEKQWTTAVLTANVRFLLLMLAAQHYEEDMRRAGRVFITELLYSLICKSKS